VREPEVTLVPAAPRDIAGRGPATAPAAADTALADEVGRALDRLLGRA
jgi:hypothetical protein